VPGAGTVAFVSEVGWFPFLISNSCPGRLKTLGTHEDRARNERGFPILKPGGHRLDYKIRSYVPSQIPHRTQQLPRARNNLQPILEGGPGDACSSQSFQEIFS
jgi:hypothetical protein